MIRGDKRGEYGIDYDPSTLYNAMEKPMIL